MPPYTPTVWENETEPGVGTTPIDAAALNKIEQGVDTAHSAIDSEITNRTTAVQGEATARANADTAEAAARVAADNAEATARGNADAALSGRLDTVEDTLPLKADLIDDLIPTSQIPAQALTAYLGDVATDAAMIALVGQSGDWVTRSDLPGMAIVIAEPSSILGNWKKIVFPSGSVASVNGQTGVIVLGKADIGLGSVDNTSDVNKPVSTAAQTALNAKAPNDPFFIVLEAATGLSNEFLFANLHGIGTEAQRNALGLVTRHAGALWVRTDGSLGAYIEMWLGSSWVQITRAINDFTGPQLIGSSFEEFVGMAAPANPVAGSRRLFVDSVTGKLSVRTSGGSTLSLEEQGGGGGGTAELLATNQITTGGVTNLSTTIADIAGATLTVTVPANGKLRVMISSMFSVAASSTKAQAVLREGSTTVGAAQTCFNVASGGGRANPVWYLTGLTPGEHTYKLSGIMATGTGSVPADVVTLEAWAMP